MASVSLYDAIAYPHTLSDIVSFIKKTWIIAKKHIIGSTKVRKLTLAFSVTFELFCQFWANEYLAKNNLECWNDKVLTNQSSIYPTHMLGLSKVLAKSDFVFII